MKSLANRIVLFLVTLVAVPFFTGCGRDVTPMKGKIVFRDTQAAATELAGYTVSFQSVTDDTMGTATIDSDGTFVVSTYGDLDGLKIGMHRITLNPPIDNANGEMLEENPVYDVKYNSFRYTDLEVQVTAEMEEVVLQIDRAKE
jgi:hypothetical protein